MNEFINLKKKKAHISDLKKNTQTERFVIYVKYISYALAAPYGAIFAFAASHDQPILSASTWVYIALAFMFGFFLMYLFEYICSLVYFFLFYEHRGTFRDHVKTVIVSAAILGLVSTFVFLWLLHI